MPLRPAPKEFSGFCPIPPMPKGRPRFTRNGHAYTPRETREYEAAVRAWLRQAYGHPRMPMGGALRADYEFVIPKPKSVPRRESLSSTKPDVDNYVKAFQDAFEFGCKSQDGIALGVVENDSRIAHVAATKRYAVDGEPLGTRFRVTGAYGDVVVFDPGVPAAAVDLLDRGLVRVPLADGQALARDARVTRAFVMMSGDELVDAAVEAARAAYPSLEDIVVI